MNKTKRAVILVIAFIVLFIIGISIQAATGFKAIMPIAMVPVAALWFYLFPVSSKK